MKPAFLTQREKTGSSRLALRGGSYSIISTVIVLAILIVINILAGALPTSLTRYDISSSRLYSITSNTKVVVNALKKDVTIYWITQPGQEDDVISNLLDKYRSLSDHIKIVDKNPDIYPTFAAQYTEETVQNNSLVVECGKRSRYIGYDDIYIQQADMSSYYQNTASQNVSFDGEGAITSAIDYVVNEDQPRLYILEGHGEAELPSDVASQIERENMETDTISLLTQDSIPEDADCILIYAPESDISQKEKKLLAEYVADGGKLMAAVGPTKKGTLKRICSLLSDYGVTVNDGIVIDTDREHYAFTAPYVLLPDIMENEITQPLIDEKYYAIMPAAQGLTVKNTDNTATVTELLTTSDSSFSKIDGYSLSSYEKEKGDIDGPFCLAVSIECDSGGQIIWFSSSQFLDETYNAYSSGANMNMAINSLSSLIGEREAIAIRSKSMNYNYLTISDSAASLLKIVMIGVFPLLYLGLGITTVLERKRQQKTA